MSLTNKPHSALNQTGEVLRHQSHAIFEKWMACLAEKWGEPRSARIAQLRSERSSGKDLLSIIERAMRDGASIEDLACPSLLVLLRKPDYSIVDLFVEIHWLEHSILDVLRGQFLPGVPDPETITGELSEVLIVCLKNTSEIYEHVLETGRRGFCQVDSSGRIVYGNEEFRRLISSDEPAGKQLASFFEGEERDSVTEALRGPDRLLRALWLRTERGDRVIVGAEIGRLNICGENRGGYASLMDISRAMKLQDEVFDHSPLGIVKLNLNAEIIYANPASCKILGAGAAEALRGKHVRQITDEINHQKIEAQLRQRRLGKSAEYEVELTRLDDGRQIPISLAAMPETDLKGKIIGSVGIMRTIVVEKATQEIHNRIHKLHDGQAILAALAEEVKKVVPYDLLITSLYSADFEHARPLYTTQSTFRWRRRWWALKSAAKKWVNENRSLVAGDLEEYLAQERWQDLKQDAEFKQLLDIGLRYFIWVPVVREDRIVASMTLYARGKFVQDATETLQKISLDHAILMSLSHQEKEELDFRLQLFRAVSAASTDVSRAAQIVVDTVGAHYEWDNVAFFVVDEPRGVFRLLAQRGNSTNKDFKPGVTQELGAGILGAVYATKQGILIGNVDTSGEYKAIYRSVLPETRSELCLPVIVDTQIKWLFNVEDARENAFAAEEKEALETILQELKLLLERSHQHHVLQTILESASDLIIVTDDRGAIRKVNPSTTTTLGYRADQMIGTPMRTYLKSESNADDLINAVSRRTDEVWLRKSDNEFQNVLMSVASLPEPISGKMFIAKDLEPYKKAKQLDILESVYAEIACQIKTPLSLVSHWLQCLTKQSDPENLADVLKQIQRQLTQIELPYDRLFLAVATKKPLPYNETLLDLSEVTVALRKSFPTTDLQESVRIGSTDGLALIRGDLFQLSFCLMTILAYFLRFVPEDRVISLNFSCTGTWLVIEIVGFIPKLADQGTAEACDRLAASRLLFDIGLGETVIRKFVANHRGEFDWSRKESDEVCFKIQLPVA